VNDPAAALLSAVHVLCPAAVSACSVFSAPVIVVLRVHLHAVTLAIRTRGIRITRSAGRSAGIGTGIRTGIGTGIAVRITVLVGFTQIKKLGRSAGRAPIVFSVQLSVVFSIPAQSHKHLIPSAYSPNQNLSINCRLSVQSVTVHALLKGVYM
jgi:hypothetical protein